MTRIKQQLFETECGVSSDSCDAQLQKEEFCSTKHCLGTYENFDVPEELHALWSCILDAQGGEYPLDYDECLEALGGGLEPEERPEAREVVEERVSGVVTATGAANGLASGNAAVAAPSGGALEG